MFIAFSGILVADRKVANYWFGSFVADWTITSKIQHVFLRGGRKKALGEGDKQHSHWYKRFPPREIKINL